MFWTVLSALALANFGFKCPYHQHVDPNFNVELFHLQDASPANSRGRNKIKALYKSFIQELLDADVKVKFGTAGFVDDNGLRGNENGRFCYKSVSTMSPVNTVVEALERVNSVPADQSNYDRYEAGFKAMTMAAKKDGGVVEWSQDPSTMKFLVTASNAAPKVNEGLRKCTSKSSKTWNDCEVWVRNAHFQSADECLDVTNQPTYDDFAGLADKSIIYLNFVYYNDSELESYFGARSRWGSVTYELGKRGFRVTLVDESRYYYIYNSMMRAVEEKACISNDVTTSTTTTTEVTGNLPAECEGRLSKACYCGADNGTSYKGNLAVTDGGFNCIYWRDGVRHTDTEGNFCRNPTPDLADRPWCYTNDHGGWGWCSIAKCGCEGFNPEKCGCDSSNKVDYRGKINRTQGGKICQKWASQEPHTHSYTPDSVKYEGYGLEENYCRNPGNEEPRPWCFIDSEFGDRWDYCDVPSCEQQI